MNEKICDYEKRINIESDINDSLNCQLVRTNEPPQLTPFRCVIAKDRYVHYRRWTDIVYSDKKVIKSFDKYELKINKEQYHSINSIDNTLLILEFDYLKSLDLFWHIFSRENKICMKIGDIVLLDCGLDTLLEIFKINKSSYDDMIESLDRWKRLEIPIHNFVLRSSLMITHFVENSYDYKIDVLIGDNELKKMIQKCYINFEAAQTTDTEYKRGKSCGLEQIFYDHAYEYYECSGDKIEIPLKGNELIRDISVKIISGKVEKVTLDERPLTKTSEPYYLRNMNKSIIKNDISYIFSSTLTRFNDKEDIYSGYIQGKNKYIVINNTNYYEKIRILMVIRYDNFFQSNGTVYFKYGFNPKSISDNNNYPLTKVDNEYREGFWRDTTYYLTPGPKYPFPLEGKIDVDSKFIEKLNEVIKAGKVNKEEHSICINQYFGSSRCRLCDCINGSEEYVVKNKEGIKFVFPSGLLHYYVDHKVQPSKEFYDFIMNYTIEES
jgi:hypothetical protein